MQTKREGNAKAMDLMDVKEGQGKKDTWNHLARDSQQPTLQP